MTFSAVSCRAVQCRGHHRSTPAFSSSDPHQGQRLSAHNVEPAHRDHGRSTYHVLHRRRSTRSDLESEQRQHHILLPLSVREKEILEIPKFNLCNDVLSFTFLATLLLLLAVSCAIVARSLVVRRRFRRRVEEAIAAGLISPQQAAMGAGFGGGGMRKRDIGQKPTMWDSWLAPGEAKWSEIKVRHAILTADSVFSMLNIYLCAACLGESDFRHPHRRWPSPRNAQKQRTVLCYEF